MAAAGRDHVPVEAREHAMAGQGYDVVVLSFRLNSREPLPQLLSRVLDVSLAEAKAFAKGFPFVVRRGISHEAAEVVRQALEAAGARVQVQPAQAAESSESVAPEPKADASSVAAPIGVPLAVVAVVSKRMPAQPSSAAPVRAAVNPLADTVQLDSSSVSAMISSIPGPSPSRAPAAPSPALAPLPAFADDAVSNDNALFDHVPDMTPGFSLPARDEPSAASELFMASSTKFEEPEAASDSGQAINDAFARAAEQETHESKTAPVKREPWAVAPPRPLPVHFHHSKPAPEPNEPIPWRALAGLAVGAVVVVFLLLR